MKTKPSREEGSARFPLLIAVNLLLLVLMGLVVGALLTLAASAALNERNANAQRRQSEVNWFLKSSEFRDQSRNYWAASDRKSIYPVGASSVGGITPYLTELSINYSQFVFPYRCFSQWNVAEQVMFACLALSVDRRQPNMFLALVRCELTKERQHLRSKDFEIELRTNDFSKRWRLRGTAQKDDTVRLTHVGNDERVNGHLLPLTTRTPVSCPANHKPAEILTARIRARCVWFEAEGQGSLSDLKTERGCNMRGGEDVGRAGQLRPDEVEKDQRFVKWVARAQVRVRAFAADDALIGEVPVGQGERLVALDWLPLAPEDTLSIEGHPVFGLRARKVPNNSWSALDALDRLLSYAAAADPKSYVIERVFPAKGEQQRSYSTSETEGVPYTVTINNKSDDVGFGRLVRLQMVSLVENNLTLFIFAVSMLGLIFLAMNSQILYPIYQITSELRRNMAHENDSTTWRFPVLKRLARHRTEIGTLASVVFLSMRQRRKIRMQAETIEGQSEKLDRQSGTVLAQMERHRAITNVLPHEVLEPVERLVSCLSKPIEDAALREQAWDDAKRAQAALSVIRAIYNEMSVEPETEVVDIARRIQAFVESQQGVQFNPIGFHLADTQLDTWCKVDMFQIDLAIIKLLQNANQRRAEGTEIRVSLVAEASAVKISVDNEGPEIAEDQMTRIFDFGRTDGGGSGIGLFMAQLYVKVNGGRLYAQPRRNGARFVIELPRVRR